MHEYADSFEERLSTGAALYGGESGRGTSRSCATEAEDGDRPPAKALGRRTKQARRDCGPCERPPDPLNRCILNKTIKR